MSIARSASPETIASPARRPWQAPLLNELSLRAATKANDAVSMPPDHPPEPAAPSSKLGFSLEAAFPLASRSK
jgi:hypothetical protein